MPAIVPTVPTTQAERIRRRSRPGADCLNALIATAQRTVLIAERHARDFGCTEEAAALVTARAHLLDVEWCCIEADIAAGAPDESHGEQEQGPTAEPTELPTDTDEALRTLLARELDEREDEAGGMTAFAQSTGLGFREMLDYARGRRFSAGTAKRPQLSLEKSQAVAHAMGYRLQLVREDGEVETADAHLRRRLAEEIENRKDPFRNTNDIEEATGIKFRQLMEYARGVRVVNGTERRSFVSVEQAEKLAAFFGMRLSVCS